MMRGCYLLHALWPIGNPANPRAQAQHYIGYGEPLERRIADQLRGNGAAACLPRAFVQAGVPLLVARTWPRKGRDFERALKRQHNAKRLCPACQPLPWETPEGGR